MWRDEHTYPVINAFVKSRLSGCVSLLRMGLLLVLGRARPLHVCCVVALHAMTPYLFARAVLHSPVQAEDPVYRGVRIEYAGCRRSGVISTHGMNNRTLFFGSWRAIATEGSILYRVEGFVSVVPNGEGGTRGARKAMGHVRQN